MELVLLVFKSWLELVLVCHFGVNGRLIDCGISQCKRRFVTFGYDKLNLSYL